MFYDKNRVDYVGNLDFAEAVTLTWPVGQQVLVKRIILVGVELGNGAEIITVAVRDADGAGGSTTIGTFTIPNAAAVDEVRFVNLADRDTGPTTAADGSTTYDGGEGDVPVEPGQEMSFTSTGATATTGQADVYVEYVPQGNNEEADYLDAVLAFTPA